MDCHIVGRNRDRLSGLKKLQELHIPNMRHHVHNVQEVKWMVEHWPKLSKLVGLDLDSKAYTWLSLNYPGIKLQ